MKNSVWHNRSAQPDINKRIIIISPGYPKGHEMRVRVIDAQFFNICSEAECWAYTDDIEEEALNSHPS